MSDDPFAVLGLGREATLDDVRAARRRLAFDVHPDRAGGDASEMQRVNAAFEACVAHLTGRRPLDPPASQTPAPQTPAQKPTTSYRSPDPGASTGRRSRRPGPVERDAPSFTVDEAVATGACVQAAAVADGVLHDEIVRRWGLGGVTPISDRAGADAAAAAVRESYAATRRAAHPGT